MFILASFPAGFALGSLPLLGSFGDLRLLHVVTRVLSYPQLIPWILFLASWTNFWAIHFSHSWAHFDHSTQSYPIPEHPEYWAPRILSTQYPEHQENMDDIWQKAVKRICKNCCVTSTQTSEVKPMVITTSTAVPTSAALNTVGQCNNRLLQMKNE